MHQVRCSSRIGPAPCPRRIRACLGREDFQTYGYYPQTSTHFGTETPPPPSIAQPLLCFTRDTNLGDKLVRARLRTAKPAKSTSSVIIPVAPTFQQVNSPCGTPTCGCCPLMSGRAGIFPGLVFYPSPTPTHCNCKSLIYLLECKLCGTKGRYVGQTSRPLRTRLAGHRRDYLDRKNMPTLEKAWTFLL